MPAEDPNVAYVDPNVAYVDPNVAYVDPNDDDTEDIQAHAIVYSDRGLPAMTAITDSLFEDQFPLSRVLHRWLSDQAQLDIDGRLKDRQGTYHELSLLQRSDNEFCLGTVIGNDGHIVTVLFFDHSFGRYPIDWYRSNAYGMYRHELDSINGSVCMHS